MQSENIFILTSEWLDFKGKNILRFWGITELHKVVEVIIDNVKPVFFIKRNSLVETLIKNFKRKKVELKSFSGEDVDALYFNTQKELKDAASILRSAMVTTYESDLDPAKRFLMERFINVQMNVCGEPIQKEKSLLFRNPKIKPCEIKPQFKVLSLDIETSSSENKIYSIATVLRYQDEEEQIVFMVGDEPKKKKRHHLQLYNSEKELLSAFFIWFNFVDPDIIIGWHVIGFDLMFIERRCQELEQPFNLARGNGKVVLKYRKSGSYFANIPGRIVIDGPPALRSAFYSFEDFKLETVAQEILGIGKTISSTQNKIKEIEYLFKEDKQKLAEYNLTDARLVADIFQKTGIIELSVKRAQLSGLFLDQLGMMTAAFDHFFLPRLHRTGFVAPNINDIFETKHAAGGYVIEPKPGIYADVIVLDFKSLYPSIIQTFKIDPLARLLSDENTILTPGGFKFSATKNFLPEFISNLMEQRNEAKRKNDKYLSQAIKILMNSFYGVMGSYGCRFYHPDLPAAITSTGKWLLLNSKVFLESDGYEVIYGDTDSLFIKMKEHEIKNFNEQGAFIADKLNSYWKEKLKNEYKVESHLEIEYEKYYKEFILTQSRGSEIGAKKRYAGLLIENNKQKIDFVGMEFVRSDWTKLAKDFQVELYDRIFNNKEIDEWIRNYVWRIKKGEFDNNLIYMKRLRKNVDYYVKNIPPHVKAARLVGKKSGTVFYVITKHGPVPIELDYSDIDYEHYIEKQIKPIADSVLNILGKSFDSIIKSKQLNMFDE